MEIFQPASSAALNMESRGSQYVEYWGRCGTETRSKIAQTEPRKRPTGQPTGRQSPVVRLTGKYLIKKMPSVALPGSMRRVTYMRIGSAATTRLSARVRLGATNSEPFEGQFSVIQ